MKRFEESIERARWLSVGCQHAMFVPHLLHFHPARAVAGSLFFDKPYRSEKVFEACQSLCNGDDKSAKRHQVGISEVIQPTPPRHELFTEWPKCGRPEPCAEEGVVDAEPAARVIGAAWHGIATFFKGQRHGNCRRQRSTSSHPKNAEGPAANQRPPPRGHREG